MNYIKFNVVEIMFFQEIKRVAQASSTYTPGLHYNLIEEMKEDVGIYVNPDHFELHSINYFEDQYYKIKVREINSNEFINLISFYLKPTSHGLQEQATSDLEIPEYHLSQVNNIKFNINTVVSATDC
jgi:hypothetical protein